MSYNYSQYQPNGGYQWNPYYPTAVNTQQYSGAGMQTAVPMNQMQQPQQSQQTNQSTGNQGFVWVQGEAGAKAYPVGPGESVLLMDSERDCFYIKSTDVSGVPMPLRTFTYTEVVQTQNVMHHENKMDSSQYVTRDEFEELKRMLQDRQSRRDNRGGEQAFSRNTKQQPNE